MIQENIEGDRFKKRMSESLRRETIHSQTSKFAKYDLVYNCGDQDATIYFIESGQIKLYMLSPDNKECLLAIHTTGEIFGELCLSGLGVRQETASAMEATVIKQIPSSRFLARLSRDSLFEGYVQHLAVRIADQLQAIANLVTVDNEQRLGQTLLTLARTLGKEDPHSKRIELNLTDQQLSEMVGTTEHQIGIFMQRFRNLGLIETNKDQFLIIEEKKLGAYLTQIS
ncbi:MAG TPA: Crp/Fnr family transcriptional regulator [Blastocatellia bacterium]|jgi:CRP/FNR family transcriptional regulator, cyclic AMP receptor protein